MIKFFTMLLVLSGCFLIALGIEWLIWKLWLYVIPNLFPSASENLKNPSFWLFVGGWTLMCMILRQLKSSKD